MTLLGPAPANPVPVTPAPRPGSVRRTSTIDISRAGADPLDVTADLLVEGRAADTRTGTDGALRRLDEARTSARVTAARVVTELEVAPDPGGLTGLLGRAAASGWRAAVRDALPTGGSTPLGLLLDDLPIAVLLAPYAAVRAGVIGTGNGWTDGMARMRDYCSGWAGDATMMRSIDAGGGIPPMPFVPAPAPPDPPLAVGALRRARRIDVGPQESGAREVEATFRDSWHDSAGVEAVLHEYVVRLRLDRGGLIEAIDVQPRVLPWPECPRAAASGQRLVGTEIAAAARDVVPSFSGPGTCTHLNDLLRSLACVPALAAGADG